MKIATLSLFEKDLQVFKHVCVSFTDNTNEPKINSYSIANATKTITVKLALEGV